MTSRDDAHPPGFDPARDGVAGERNDRWPADPGLWPSGPVEFGPRITGDAADRHFHTTVRVDVMKKKDAAIEAARLCLETWENTGVGFRPTVERFAALKAALRDLDGG